MQHDIGGQGSHREARTQVPIIKFDTEEEAVAMANDTEYGLASYFYTTVPPPPPPLLPAHRRSGLPERYT